MNSIIFGNAALGNRRSQSVFSRREGCMNTLKELTGERNKAEKRMMGYLKELGYGG